MFQGRLRVLEGDKQLGMTGDPDLGRSNFHPTHKRLHFRGEPGLAHE